MAKVTTGFPSSGRSEDFSVPATVLPSREKGQKSLSVDQLYIRRWVTPWAQPEGISANSWRAFVKAQGVAMDCKEAIQASLLGFDWSVTARDSNLIDELKPTAKYYTKLIDRGGEYYDFGYEGLIEWILQDFLDIPFGAGAEIGRRGNKPNGRTVWVKPIDGATLYPTLNAENPVLQYYNGHYVLFPKEFISRMYMTPRTNIKKEGWGLAPPEKVYYAMEALARGDKYYANLLLDTPPAGILDLGDMEQSSAIQWVEAFREFVHGSPSSFSIPVLYEHTTDVKFIPFGQVPNDIMYDRITLKYAAIVAAAYGLSLSDIGLQTTSASGETLAGSIRQERRTRRTGFARAKKAIKHFMESFLPYTLQFNIIDPDEEVNLAQGRSRLSNFTAMGQAIDAGTFTRQEARIQMIKDGLMSQDFPEELPEELEDFESQEEQNQNTPERPGSLGSPESAASGGQGEVRVSTVGVQKSKSFDAHVFNLINTLSKDIADKIKEQQRATSEDEIYLLSQIIDGAIFGEDDVLEIGEHIKSAWDGTRWFKMKYGDIEKELKTIFNKQGLQDVNVKSFVSDLKKDLPKELKGFLAKSGIYLLKEAILSKNVFDVQSSENDNSNVNIVQEVYKSFMEGFDEYVQTYVGMKVQNLISQKGQL